VKNDKTSNIVMGLMVTGIVIVMALLVTTILQSTSIVTTYASNDVINESSTYAAFPGGTAVPANLTYRDRVTAVTVIWNGTSGVVPTTNYTVDLALGNYNITDPKYENVTTYKITYANNRLVGTYAYNATTNVSSGLNVFSTLFPLFAIVAGIIVLLGYLSFGRGKKR